MSIASEIQRLQTAKADIKRALERKGYTVPSAYTIDEYAAIIDPITQGKALTYRDNPNHYLTFKFVQDGKFGWNAYGNISRTIQYSLDGSTWTDMTPGQSISVNKNDEIWVKGTNIEYATSTSVYCYFSTLGKAYISGNVNSLVNFSNELESTCAFCNLFKNCYFLDIDKSIGLSLPATTLATYCYYYMFQGCTNLTTAPELPATTLVNNCYRQMFQNCYRLNYIKAMFTTTPSSGFTLNWVNGVASSGTFVKNSAATWNVTGTFGVPSGWTVETASE